MAGWNEAKDTMRWWCWWHLNWERTRDSEERIKGRVTDEFSSQRLRWEEDQGIFAQVKKENKKTVKTSSKALHNSASRVKWRNEGRKYQSKALILIDKSNRRREGLKVSKHLGRIGHHCSPFTSHSTWCSVPAKVTVWSTSCHKVTRVSLYTYYKPTILLPEN
jgi:hypothetical protein